MSSLIGKLETDMELNASAGRFMACSATGLPKFPRLLMIRYEHVLYMKVNGAKEGFIISWNYDHGFQELRIQKSSFSKEPRLYVTLDIGVREIARGYSKSSDNVT
ncbi:hypothetical protein Golob_021784, partial [Gossypium lobatum]|nr:hypothetical protein [Gossypium lobatum]